MEVHSDIQDKKVQVSLSLKGQLISKDLFGIFNFPKKRTKKIDFITIVPHVKWFSFFGRLEDIKKTFRN